MIDIALLALGFFAWSMIWVVPASLAGTRRRKGKSAYWLLLAIAMLIEIGIVFGAMQTSIWLGFSKTGFLLSPLLGAIFSGYYYWYVAKERDRMKERESGSQIAE